MKTIICLFFFFLLFFKLSGQEVSFDEAKKTASDFFFANDKTALPLKSSLIVKVDSFATYYTIYENQLKSATKANEPAFYIFNRIDKPGFVIISGDKRIKDILAYSNNSVFSDPNPGLKALLNQYVKEINYVKENNINSIILPSVNNLATNGGWLLGNIEWHQVPHPFNSKCPPDINSIAGNEIVPTGCVATAMAQIIYYHKYPRYGKGYYSYQSNYRPEIADFENTEYKYELMEDKPTYGIENEDIATLLYHCGVSVDMKYGPKGSAAEPTSKIETAFETYFNYKDCYKKERSIISFSWGQSIKDEIENGRPVYYEADDITGTAEHAFIIDGYDFTFGEIFHINWGYGGVNNAMYSLDALNTSLGNYSQLGQRMIIGIEPKDFIDLKPANQSLSSATVQAGSSIIAYCAEENLGNILAGANVVSIHLSVDNELTPDQNGDRYLDEINIPGVAAKSTSNRYSKSITIPLDVTAGNYYVFFSADGGEDVPEMVENNNRKTVQLTVTGAVPTPTISVLYSSLAFGDVTVNNSLTKNFTVSGSNLTGNVSVSVSGTGYTISKSSSSGFGTSELSFSPSGGTLSDQTVYVRLSPTSTGSKPGSITVSSTGASSKTVSLSGAGTTVATPTIVASESSLSFGNVTVNTNSTKSFTISGSNLTSSVAVAVSGSGYLISKSPGSGFTGALSFTPSGGTLTNQTVYVSFNPTSVGSKSGTIAIVSSGANDILVPLTGNGISGSAQPSNDYSCSPQPLTVRTSCSYEPFTTVNATTQAISFTGKTNSYLPSRYDDDVWFSIKPSSSSEVTINVRPTSNQNNFDIVLGLYQGSCSNPTQIQIGQGVAGNEGDPESIIFTPQANTTYLIRVFSYGETSSYSGDFDICVTSEDGEEEEEGDDFYVQNVNVQPTTIQAGGTIDVSCDQCYSGSKLDSEMGTVYLGYYLSTNTTFGSSDKPLDKSPSSLGSDDRCNSESETLTIPISTTPGDYYILFVADDYDSFDETDESNNVEYIPVTVTVGTGKPDLTIDYISYTPATITPGTLVRVNYTKSNIGDMDAPTNSIGIYISNDDVFDQNTDKFLDDWTNGGPKAGASYTDLLNFDIPNCNSCGTYWIFLVSDYKKAVDESDESNNYDSFQIQIFGCTTCSYSVPANGINFQSAGGSGNFNVTTTECCEWTASTTDNFITILNSHGVGNGIVSYSISPSSAGGSRTGTIKVAGQTHTITQNCDEVCNNSQSFEWAVKAGSTTLSDAANDLTIDASGNLFMTGDIQGAATFGGGITLTTPSTAPDVFVSMHNSSGQIQWAVRYGDTDQEYGTGIATDNNGNIYVIGVSANDITFGSTTLTANGTNEEIAFLIKLNSSGILQWAKKLNTLYSGSASDIVIDNSNNIFITGSLSDYHQGNGDGFYIAKYNTSGIQVWYNTYGFGFHTKQAFGIATDNLGNIFISGRYLQTMTLGSTTLRASATLDMDGFISKFDANGNVIWAKQLTSPGQGQDKFNSIVVDEANNIYTIGDVDSTAIIGDITIPLKDGSKLIIVKYDQNGNPQWAKASVEGSQYNQTRIFKGNDNNIYFAGCFNNTLKLDTKIITGFGSNDAFIGCIDINGTIKWLKGFGGSQSDGVGGIVTNSNNDIFVAGVFENTVNFGNTTLTSSGSSDIFLAKFKQCDPPNATIVYTGSLRICPGESKSLETEYCSSYAYQWALNNINIPEAILPTYIATEAGSYTVKVSSFEGCESISPAVDLIINTITKPIITQNGNLLLSTTATNYQWNLNENPINGATSQFYEPLVSGDYSVSVTYSSGCSAISDIIVIKENQTIIFDALPGKTVCDLMFDLIASASSGLPVTFISSNNDVAAISGNKVTIVGAGTTEITATQSGNSDFNAAPSIKRTLTVTENSNPTAQASGIAFSGIGMNSMTANWTNGNGGRRVVKINTTNSFSAPGNGTDPAANSSYSGSGEQVVYNGSGSSVTVTGLLAGTTYWFRAYEANCSGSSSQYYTATASNNPQSQVTSTSCTTPTTQASGIAFSGIGANSMTANWTNGNGGRRVVKINTTNSFSAPGNGTDSAANSSYSGSGEQVVYNGSGSSVTVTGLLAGTTYWFRAYEANCSGSSSQYYTATASNNPQSQVTSTSCTTPTTQASGIAFSGVGANSMTANWTNGNGGRRVVKINTTNSFSAPGNGTDPAANSSYSGSGEQVVYNGSGSSVTVTGLSASTTYWFRVYEANCSGSTSQYYTATASNNPQSQVTNTSCTAPTTQASGIAFSGIGANSMTANWTNGNGGRRVVKINTTNSFSAPGNGTDPAANSSYSGSGEQVVYNGSGSSVTVTGLSASTTYWFRVYEANCSGSSSQYYTASANNNPNSKSSTTQTCIAPGIPINILGIGTGESTATLSWSPGSPVGSPEITYYWVVGVTPSVIYGSGLRQNTTSETTALATGLPTGTYYLRVQAFTNCDGQRSEYGTSLPFTIGCTPPTIIAQPSNRSVTAPNSTSFSVTATGSHNQYRWQMSEGLTWVDVPSSPPYSNVDTQSLNINSTSANMNGYQFRCIISSPCGTSITSDPATLIINCTPPSIPASNLSLIPSNNSMFVGWTSGNGTAGLVVARAGSAVNANPVNGVTYIANSTFGSGTQIGTGNYVVYNGTGSSVNLTGLSQATTYHFAVYEYNFSTKCYQAQPLTGSSTTQGSPSLLTVAPGNQNVPATPAGSTTFSVTSNSAWTATDNQSWCSVTSSGSGNGTIVANYISNSGASPRVAAITVTVVGLTPQTVTVTQSGPIITPTLSITPSNRDVPATPAGSTNFTVTSNSAWTATSNQGWCTVTPSGNGNGTIIANYTANTGSQRTATITVTVQGLTPQTVTVTQASGESICYPQWQPVQNQQFNMTVIAKLYISNVLTTNRADSIGAFVGEECRGKGFPDPTLNGTIFLTVSSNVGSGETITFKAWKSGQCEVCDISETLPFVNQSEAGTINAPFEFHCGASQLCVDFGAGYTWFSVNVNPGSMSLNSLFSNLSPQENDRIVGQQLFAAYSGNQWVGSLASIDPKAMYKMKLSTQQTWCKQGTPVAISPINVGSGYPWIGYLPQDENPINIALANISPVPAANDRFNGQASFATYSGTQWVGSLSTLQKGKGYIIHLASPSVLTYPNGSGSPVANIQQSPDMVTLKGDIIKSSPLYNMQIIGNIVLQDGQRSFDGEDIVYAYVGNECRGMAKPVANLGGRLFLSIGSDIKSGEQVLFKVFVSKENRLYDVKNRIVFISEMETGTIKTPYLFETANTTWAPLIRNNSGFTLGEVYPNPFNEQASLNFNLEMPGKITGRIIDVFGKEMRLVMDNELGSGPYIMNIDGSALAPGFYYLLITYTNKNTNSSISKKMIIK